LLALAVELADEVDEVRPGSLSKEGDDEHVSRMSVRSEPVLIGPAYVGKSTVGAALAERIGLGFVDLDAVGDTYYSAAGMALAEFEAQIQTRGHSLAHGWWQPARVAGVRGVLADYHASVIALGAGHTHYEDDVYFENVRELLEPFVNVFLLLPSADTGESVDILRRRSIDRGGHGWDHDGRDWLREWCESAQNRALATRTVYTAGRSVHETVDQVAALIG
jgi:shikimate kinase